jgi:predicted transcriptional regulator YdeE
MQPTLQRKEAFNVSGLTIRTTNEAVEDPKAGAINVLWTRFFDERIYQSTPDRINDMRLYGVYSRYESDDRGPFDITAGVAVAKGPSAIRIEAGDYLVFTAQGEMPKMVLSLWQTIWKYFEQHPEIRRSYRSDFEAYSGPEEVAIHIGVILE